MASFSAEAQDFTFSNIQLTLPAGSSPVGVVVADMNNDNIPDVVSLNQGSGSVSVFLGRGGGTFAPPSTTYVGASLRSMVPGDFNRDGNMDLAISSDNPGVFILDGKGDGTFGPPRTINTGGALYAMSLADFNADGSPDLVGVNFNQNQLVVLLGMGDGTFGFPRTWMTGFDPSSVKVMDIDLDGNLDLVVTNQFDCTASVFKGDDKGNFTEIPGFRSQFTFPAVNGVRNVDVNNDGFPDFEFFGSGTGVEIFENVPSSLGTFGSPITFASGLAGINDLAIGDINADGYPDFVLSTASGQVQIYSGSFLAPQSRGGLHPLAVAPSPPIVLTPTGNPKGIAIGDLNADGKADLAVANPVTNSIFVYTNVSPKGILPQTGWWWDPTLNGTGFFIETGGVSGSGIFVGGFLYDPNGNNTWMVSTGQMTSPVQYSNNWLKVTGGQTLTGAYQAPSSQVPAGKIALSFLDSSHAVMTRPDGTSVNLHRFSFTNTFAPSAPEPGAPQVGWWWAGSAFSGTGYGIEIQGASVFIVAFVYDSSGNPVWYLATGGLTSPTSYSGSWYQYSGGPQLTSKEGKYQATQVASSAVPMSLTFSDSTHGTLTMGNMVVPIVRFLQY